MEKLHYKCTVYLRNGPSIAGVTTKEEKDQLVNLVNSFDPEVARRPFFVIYDGNYQKEHHFLVGDILALSFEYIGYCIGGG